MSGSDQPNELQKLIVEYQERRDSGEPIDQEQFIKMHPDQAEELRECLEELGMDRPPTSGNALSGGLESTTRIELGVRTTYAKSGAQSPKAPMVPDDTVWTDPEELAPMFGRYRIERRLGEGTMGAVLLAHDTLLDRKVALKLPKLGDAPDTEVKQRFYREARAAAALRHVNICPVFDIGEEQGQIYLTMAYIEGQLLTDYIESNKRHSERQVAVLVRKIAKGVAEAHRQGVIHRDLKPANVMVDFNCEPVVMDFGLARRDSADEGQVTQLGTIVGTPAYMPPEQLGGNRELIGPQTDIYSLGVIMYELLTGRRPYRGSIMSILQQVAVTDPIPLNQLRVDLNPILEDICQKMMSKSIEHRYQSMGDVSNALAGFLVNPRDNETATISEILPTHHSKSNSTGGDNRVDAMDSSGASHSQPDNYATDSDTITIRLLDPHSETARTKWQFARDEPILIGRGAEADVRILNKKVSRAHAAIFYSAESQWQFSNLGKNGASIDGQRQQESDLKNGTLIQLSVTGPRLRIDLNVTSRPT